MAKVQISIFLERDMLRELHRQMGKVITDEDGVVRYRQCESTIKQDWYRRVLRRGLDSFIREFNKKKKELEDNEI